ncbi:MAG: DEAD/DEAH box helicase [Candidatus Andersenbacteria bacterium]|nr:DEAD/DEAH box helicase [Candidatus Andersenbacteria bacterium]
MANTKSQSDHLQTMQTQIKAELKPFLSAVQQKLANSQVSLPISMGEKQLPMLLAAFNTSQKPLALLVDLPHAKAQTLWQSVKAWQDFLGRPYTWHLLASPLEESEMSGEISTNASRAVQALLSAAQKNSEGDGFIITNEALQQNPPDPKAFAKQTITAVAGEDKPMQAFIKELTRAGYIRHQASLESGTFRVVGEKIDVGHPLTNESFSISWYGSRIERVIRHDGRRNQEVSRVTLPAKSLPAQTSTWPELLKNLTVIAGNGITTDIPATITYGNVNAEISFPFKTTPPAKTAQTILLYSNYDRAQAWANTQQISATLFPHKLAEIPFSLSSQLLTIISEASFTVSTPPTSSSPISLERARELLGELTVGKPAVHADHGIGIYEGLESRLVNGQPREYLTLRYAAGDALAVPVEFAHKVTPYLGESHPAIHRLGGTLWQKTRKKAQHDAVAFAQELLTINRARVNRQRLAYPISQDTEDKLTASFPFSLTPDQERTWEEVKADMQNHIPMDRLVVGDVGFGKTEIAIRAATHAAGSERQVAVIAPTTLLVQQHIDTFKNRLPHIAESIVELSRFISAKQKKQNLANITSGQATIVIGTHALLSKSVDWKNLGLVIIDEEQRFGVKHKEHFKKIRSTIDVLSLSATPIPRTLSMAVSGLRQLSVISTPPPGRQDVITHVGKINDELIKEALTRELKRHGQAYIVAPKIRQLGAIKEHVAALIPQARIAVAHGQMDEGELTKIIHSFDAKAIDILVSSSIIEHGLDLPSTNTIIIWSSLLFGLADLYQLRGRIGRRSTQGYAYFFYDQAELKAIQRARLTTLVESQRQGSGWLIAQRDLEIRGAGNLLGKEQHGATNAVGIQFYLDLINQVTEEHELFTSDVTLELPLSAAIPSHYIADARERTRWYQRLSRSRTLEDISNTQSAIQATYGPIPEETKNLVILIKLQRVAAQAGITFIGASTIAPTDEDPYARLSIKAKNIPQALAKLTSLGNWRLRGDKATLDLNQISSQLVEKMIETLK